MTHRGIDMRTGLAHATRDPEGRFISRAHAAADARRRDQRLRQEERGRVLVFPWATMVRTIPEHRAWYRRRRTRA